MLDKIFFEISETKRFLIENEIIPETVRCENCGSVAKLKEFRRNGKLKLQYRCDARGCQKTRSIFTSKLELNKLIHIIYLILLDCNYKQLYLAHGISTATISTLKKRFFDCVKLYMLQRPILLGVWV
jgi:hypothetical protein